MKLEGLFKFFHLVIFSLYLIKIVNGESKSRKIIVSKLFEIHEELTPEEKKNLENQFIIIVELFIEFAELTFQISTEVRNNLFQTMRLGLLHGFNFI